MELCYIIYYFAKLKVFKLKNDSFCCGQGLVTTDDVIVKYLKDGDPRRALHELHDGMEAYSSILLYHLTR